MRKKKAMCFFNDLYYQNFIYLKDWTREEVEDILQHDTEGSYGFSFVGKDGIYIWVEPSREGYMGRLFHEVVHAANFCLCVRGIKASEKNDEVLAYLGQWVFEECLRPVNKRKKQ